MTGVAAAPGRPAVARGAESAPWEDLYQAWRTGGTAGLATVVSVAGSAPRRPGAPMLITPDGRLVGGVSGGCVEGEVHQLAQEAVRDRIPRLVSYGMSGADAFAVGLPCGGTIEVFVEPVDARSFPELPLLIDLLRAGTPVVVATVIEHPRRAAVGRRVLVTADAAVGAAGSPPDDARIRDEARTLLRAANAGPAGPAGGTTVRLPSARGADMRLLLLPHVPPPRMLVFGANDFAAALVPQVRLLGYRTTVCDARPVFATPDRFPDADEVVVAWPHRHLAEQAAAGRLDPRTAVVSLSHDPRFEVPLLAAALRLPLGYVGAMGSRRSHTERVARLRAAGLTERQLSALSSPIGLGLATRTPAETAVSIAAELILLTRGGQAARRSPASAEPTEPAEPATKEARR